MDWLHAIAGLFVGVMVGMTGVGGGSLMAPILILLFGVAPTTAVGTDLWFAAITKSVGGFVHHRHGGAQGGPDYEVIRRLCIGSLPAAIIVLILLAQVDAHQVKSGLIMTALGIVLILTAFATLFRSRFHHWAVNARTDTAGTFLRYQAGLTMAAGALLGVMVTLTSVGAGALGATLLLALYPLRMRLQKLVATDIVHAVPLTLVAGMGHLWIGNFNLLLLLNLLIGSIPGIILGSMLASKVPERVLQPLLALVLLVAGWRLIS
ncbi:sulfite exporter TauE/SafE family protein [Sphingobium sp. BYY-5]|uniref:sulfite exporter TauE/SafE family protein n=1 Tax=Sphingobium sp. BYY-5 TaxID=2926400 RepID=UPI001FA6DC83|nr:sulfite exporter TauE/SafE family protein [Sphingobium sp. BYY-5]MCI4588652.1 sulfite exporter TauE/SafE family protein [Sphingobium sp. BYY-5]